MPNSVSPRPSRPSAPDRDGVRAGNGNRTPSPPSSTGTFAGGSWATGTPPSIISWSRPRRSPVGDSAVSCSIDGSAQEMGFAAFLLNPVEMRVLQGLLTQGFPRQAKVDLWPAGQLLYTSYSCFCSRCALAAACYGFSITLRLVIGLSSLSVKRRHPDQSIFSLTTLNTTTLTPFCSVTFWVLSWSLSAGRAVSFLNTS